MKPPNDRKETRIVALLFVMIFFTLVLFYLPMIKNWFFSDDVHWIWTSATTRFRDMFFVPEIYRSMASNFTPMLGASFRIDWLFFRMNPEGYFAHSVLSLLATSVAFYLLLRLYASRTPALAGALLLLLNPFTLTVTGWFSTRHYVEGLFWALLSLYFFIRADRKGSISPASGLFYLISSLNKEVYVILPVLAFILSSGNLSRRLRNMLPLLAGLVIYSAWRLWIMGGLGGYASNQPVTFGTIFPLSLGLVNFFSLHWFGGYHFLFYSLLAVLCFLFLRSLKVPLIFLALLLPLLPVSNIPTERFFFHISAFLIGAFSLCIDRAISRKSGLQKGIVVFTFLLVAALFVKEDIPLVREIEKERSGARTAAMTFLQSERRYIQSSQPLWFYESLRKIERRFFGKEITTRVLPPENLLRYSGPERLKEIRDSGIDIPADEMIRSQKDFRTSPLTVTLTLDQYRLTWDFGPDKDISYTVLRGPESGLYYNQSILRPSGSVMFGKTNKDGSPDMLYLKISYRSEKEGEVVSPEFMLKIPGREKIEYTTPAYR